MMSTPAVLTTAVMPASGDAGTNEGDWWASDGWFPIFRGGSDYGAHVRAWQALHADVQYGRWRLAAIAASLERSVGGRPGRHGRRETELQRFCRQVGIDRQTLQRLVHTYRVFAEVILTRTSGGTGYIPELSFKHHEVAARLGGRTGALAAIVEAHERGWSANELERQLTRRRTGGRRPKPTFTAASAYRLLYRLVETWPLSIRRQAPELLRRLAEWVEQHLPSPVYDDGDDLPDCLRELTTCDCSDPIGFRDVEAGQ